MRPPPVEPFGSLRNDREQRNPRVSDLSPTSHSTSNSRRYQNEDSWIEIASRPSTSSLSSVNNEVITTGLQVRSQGRLHRRPSTRPRAASIAGSSQDEYEESESESEKVITSSTEELPTARDDDDDNTTVVRGIDHIFTPQPNAFSHPPPIPSRASLDSYFPPVEHIQTPPRHYSEPDPQFHARQRQQVQPDHDAALRASLTTLLSCAAAVRPKVAERQSTTRPPLQPTALRIVPESEMDRGQSRSPKHKRKSRESSKERHVKKLRPVKHAIVVEEYPSSSLYMWMISAGVVLVFSAISFSAGYAWGKEVGRIEGEMGISNSCGKEAMRGGGLKRLRWTTGSTSVRA